MRPDTDQDIGDRIHTLKTGFIRPGLDPVSDPRLVPDRLLLNFTNVVIKQNYCEHMKKQFTELPQ
jgi:hypothetical protein